MFDDIAKLASMLKTCGCLMFLIPFLVGLAIYILYGFYTLR